MNCIALRMLYSIGDWHYFSVTYQQLCMNWTTQLVSAFVYFKDVSVPLESICYVGPHAWYIKENEIKQARKKKKKKKKKNDTVCKGSIQQIIN